MSTEDLLYIFAAHTRGEISRLNEGIFIALSDYHLGLLDIHHQNWAFQALLPFVEHLHHLLLALTCQDLIVCTYSIVINNLFYHKEKGAER